MEFEIWLQDAVVGSLQIRQEGLYERVCASCCAPQGLYRLYAQTDASFHLLGVPAPEGGKLVLRRRFTEGCLPKPESASFFLSEQEPWIPFSGQIDGIEVTDVCMRISKNEILYCESVQQPRALSLLPFFCQCRPYSLYGQRAILFRCSAEA